MKTEIQIKGQLERLEAQKKEIEGAIAVLKDEVKYEPYGKGIASTLGAEYASEWLEQDDDYNIFDHPMLITE